MTRSFFPVGTIDVNEDIGTGINFSTGIRCGNS